jgi:hypothetical protein
MAAPLRGDSPIPSGILFYVGLFLGKSCLWGAFCLVSSLQREVESYLAWRCCEKAMEWKLIWLITFECILSQGRELVHKFWDPALYCNKGLHKMEPGASSGKVFTVHKDCSCMRSSLYHSCKSAERQAGFMKIVTPTQETDEFFLSHNLASEISLFFFWRTGAKFHPQQLGRRNEHNRSL